MNAGNQQQPTKMGSISASSVVVVALISAALISHVESADFASRFEVTWGGNHTVFSNNGKLMDLLLDKVSGAQVQSKDRYLFMKAEMTLKLVKGNSAGTVVSFYIHSGGQQWDEVDFEFLGNVSGQPYLIHTNLYAKGKGDREQQFKITFDPTAKAYTYTILWNPNLVLWYVENTPIRVFKNLNSAGIAYPSSQPMKILASIWNGEEWATQGGRIKTNWTDAPFVSSFTGYKNNGCKISSTGASPCTPTSITTTRDWYTKQLDAATRQQILAYQSANMVYDYCKDTKRFQGTFPPECSIPI